MCKGITYILLVCKINICVITARWYPAWETKIFSDLLFC